MNKLCHASYKGNLAESPLVVRINGSIAEQYCIDRTQEIDILRMLNGRNLTPNLVASFDNGIVYEYIAGEKMSKGYLAQEGILRLIILGDNLVVENLIDLLHETMAVADPGFPVGGRQVFGGRRPLTQVLFGENVCENERIGSRWGGRAPAVPPLDPPMNGAYCLQINRIFRRLKYQKLNSQFDTLPLNIFIPHYFPI